MPVNLLPAYGAGRARDVTSVGLQPRWHSVSGQDVRNRQSFTPRKGDKRHRFAGFFIGATGLEPAFPYRRSETSEASHGPVNGAIGRPPGTASALQERRSRKPLSVVRRIEGSNPSPSASTLRARTVEPDSGIHALRSSSGLVRSDLPRWAEDCRTTVARAEASGQHDGALNRRQRI
jgi:hypothetical protein